MRRRRPRLAVMDVGSSRLGKQGADRFDWRDPYHVALTLSWPRFAAAVLALELAINLGFALLYWAVPGSVANAAPGSFGDAFFFSMETLATVGYGVMAPASFWGHVVASAELLCGMALTALVTGLIFVRFSRPRAKVAYAEHPVVARYNGTPALMLRVANPRTSLMTNGHARLSVLLLEETAEGQRFRGVHDLPLVRAHIPLFALTWTLIHVIDQRSPLHGVAPEVLVADEARLFLTVQARDEMLAAEVQDVHAWGAETILWGRRYADVVSAGPDGHPVADLTRLSATVEDERAIAGGAEAPEA